MFFRILSVDFKIAFLSACVFEIVAHLISLYDKNRVYCMLHLHFYPENDILVFHYSSVASFIDAGSNFLKRI